MRERIKQAALALSAHPVVGRLLGAFGESRCAVLMLHRFASHHGTVRGHDVASLRTTLAALRKSGIAFEYVDDVVSRIREGAPCSPKGRLSVAVTVDDGYADLLDAEHIFSEFDCPVTGFVVPGVIDGGLWFWWDQVDWVLRHAGVDRVEIAVAGEKLTLTWDNEITRLAAQELLVERLKLVRNDVRLRCLEQLSVQLEVAVPKLLPSAYRVLSWDELRAAEARGVRFGAQTMTHPVLSQCADAESEHEIVESISRVRMELSNPSLVFCYPNGRSMDYGGRETASIAAAGMLGAVTAEPALVHTSREKHGPTDWVYRLPRIPYDDRPGGIQRKFLP